MQPCIGSEGLPLLPRSAPVHFQAVSVTHLPAEALEGRPAHNRGSGTNRATGFIGGV